MIIEAAELDEDSRHDCDICIVGAGPAGLTIANALSRTSLRVCLLESGGLDVRSANRAQTLAAQFGIPIDDTKLRKRYFGGASNLWGGLSGRWFRQRPLDPLDFETRSWIPDSGWPISYDDLKPYYARACEALNILPLEHFDCAAYEGYLSPKFHDEVLRTAIFQDSRPIRFGRHYAAKMKRSRTVRVFLNATVTDIEEAENEPVVRCLEFVARNGKRHRVTARRFVLACGGLEAPRLLLSSTKKKSCGIGNEHDLVGRYFMQHPKGLHGLVRLHRSLPKFPFLLHVPVPSNVGIAAGITFSELMQRRLKVLNHCIVFNPLLSLHEGLASDAYRAIKRAWHSDHISGESLVEFLRHLRAGADGSSFMMQDFLGQSNSRLNFSLLCHMEQTPNRNSRVFLSAMRNELGQLMLHSDWRIGTLEKESLHRLHKLAKSTIESCDMGWLDTSLDATMEDWPISKDSAHYLGTTRMHESPRRGVTDEHGRVHSVENLYISASSIFPTGGYANPTLTVIALALRLADHLIELRATRLARRRERVPAF